MTYTLFTDETGTGTGDHVGDFDDLEKARAVGNDLWAPECGYTIHRTDPDGDGRDEVIVQCKPTRPDRDDRRPDPEDCFEFDPNEPPDLPEF